MLPTSTCLSSHPELSLEVFAADERPELAALYLAGQAESLRHHVEAGLRSAPLGDARIVLARDADGTAHGGMRVHLRRSGVLLPVELALGERCAIVDAVARAPAPLVELCGTWIGGRYRGSELVEAITRAALDVARALEARQIVGCAHQHVMAFYRRFGAVVDPELGVHPYPDARYETRVFWADPERCVGGGLWEAGRGELHPAPRNPTDGGCFRTEPGEPRSGRAVLSRCGILGTHVPPVRRRAPRGRRLRGPGLRGFPVG